MNNQPIGLIAHFHCKPENINELVTILSDLVKQTQVENGCILYDVFTSENDPNHVIMMERWESQASLEKHLESKHITDAKPKIFSLLAKPFEIELYKQTTSL